MYRRKSYRTGEKDFLVVRINMPGMELLPMPLGPKASEEARQEPAGRRESKNPDNEVANRLARSGMRAGVRAWKMSGMWPCDVTPAHCDRYEVPSHFQCPSVDVLGDPVAALREPGRIWKLFDKGEGGGVANRARPPSSPSLLQRELVRAARRRFCAWEEEDLCCGFGSDFFFSLFHFS